MELHALQYVIILDWIFSTITLFIGIGIGLFIAKINKD